MNFNSLFKHAMDRSIPEIRDFKPGTILNVGAGNKLIEGTIPLDYPTWDADKQPIPCMDEDISGIHAYHFLEHCQYPVQMLQEFQRVLIPGGIVNIVVPYYNAQIQAHDLDHKHFFCEDTWKILFKNPYYDKNRIHWEFSVGFNVICGIAERNLVLLTQLIKNE